MTKEIQTLMKENFSHPFQFNSIKDLFLKVMDIAHCTQDMVRIHTAMIIMAPITMIIIKMITINTTMVAMATEDVHMATITQKHLRI